MPALLFLFFFKTSFGRFCFFGDRQVLIAFIFGGSLDPSYPGGKKEEKKQGRNSMRRLVHELHGVQKSSRNS